MVDKKRAESWTHFMWVRFFPTFWTEVKARVMALVIGVVIAVLILVLQIHYGVIPSNNLHGRVFSILLPYVGILFAFLLFHLARIPWLISNEHREEFESVTVKLSASEHNNALLQEHLSKRNWPEKRPRITLDRWGQQVGPHGVLRPESGFYLTNHGDTALEVVLEDFNLGSDKWVGDRLSSIEGQQKGFMKVERTTFVYGDAQRWNLLDGFRVARKNEQRVRIRYRDFNNNWYRSTAMLTCAPNFGSIEVGATTQEPLGSS